MADKQITDFPASAGVLDTDLMWTRQGTTDKKVTAAVAKEYFSVTQATESQAGIAEIATTAEVSAGLDDTKIVSPLKLKTVVGGAIPLGIITMWSGSVGSIPDDWALCDGSSGTPDLRDRFLVGAGTLYGVGDTGGSNTSVTDSAGAHNHTISVANRTLSVSQMPSHTHPSGLTNVFVGSGAGGAGIAAEGTGIDTGATGGSSGHNHTATSTSTPNHSHNVSVVPPYYALAFIMRIS